MNRWMLLSIAISLVVFAGLALFVPPAQAGPPLVCWPFDIGDAQSLPWGGGAWSAAKADYDLSRLVEDTLGLLAPGTPVVVRMETLRRATVYAMKDRRIAGELLARLQARVRDAEAGGKPDAFALFDTGYLAETYKQARWTQQADWKLRIVNPAGGLDGYAMIRKAIALRGGNPEMELAAALVALEGRPDRDRVAHLEKALAGATDGSLLARNLVRQSQLLKLRGGTLAELRAQAGSAKN